MITTEDADQVDPVCIRDALPAPERDAFLEEYQHAVAAAADPTRYRELRWLLHTWHLRALAHADPQFEERRHAAADSTSEAFLPGHEVMPELDTRLQGRG